MKKRIVTCILIGSLSISMVLGWEEVNKVVPADRAASDEFALSTCISGNYMIAGAHLEEEDEHNINTLNHAGSAYIFYRDGETWSQQQKLVPTDRQATDYFGWSVSISGDYAIAGAYLEDHDALGGDPKSDAGSAYIFHRDGSVWTQQAKLVADDRMSVDYFGFCVSIDGDYAIVGARGSRYDTLMTNYLSYSGAAYVFHRDGITWTQQTKLVPSDRARDDYFGMRVAISGDYAIIGAYQEDHDASGNNELLGAGSAYIFHREGGTWKEQAKLVAPDRAADDRFGISVSISGDYAIIGANFEDEDADGINTLSGAGSVYVFHRTDTVWTFQKKIVNSDRAAGDYFGSSVSISGDNVIVGAYYEDEDADGINTLNAAGSAYIFKRSGTDWPQQAKLVQPYRISGVHFGNCVSISGNKVVVGVPEESRDESGTNTLSGAGAAYFFESATEVPLPICLNGFSATTKNGNVLLSWRTDSETNNAHFMIYRNGEAIGSIEGAGTTSEPHDYCFIDKTVIPGESYTYVLADITYDNRETRYEAEAVTIVLAESDIITEFALNEAYPNPFNPSTTINFQLPESGDADLSIYDLSGEKVRTLISGHRDAGSYSVSFHAGNLPSGVYLYRLTAGNEVITKKMVLMK